MALASEVAEPMSIDGAAASERSWLFVPGDSERKQTRALESGADALILDLEDSVAPARRKTARERVASLLAERRANRGAQRLWVRANAPSSGELLEDLVKIVPSAPDGLVLPKISSPEEIVETHHYLSALEKREGLRAGSIRVLVIATETARAVLGIERLAAGVPRLAGLTWGAEDLGASLGVRGRLEADGSLTPVFELARSLCLLAAAATGVAAIDGVHADFRDGEGLARELARARRDGFSGKLAIHPDQVGPINAAFTPSESEIARARRIVAAFAEAPDVGVTSLDGQMIDRPHLLQAERLLAAAERLARR
ncbi:MAG TPA: CoA ester lyase [Steroidobacteraceae bacterium]|nr:CoA ester lyase [Steroidobacteraceae bacterium]